MLGILLYSELIDLLTLLLTLRSSHRNPTYGTATTLHRETRGGRGMRVCMLYCVYVHVYHISYERGASGVSKRDHISHLSTKYEREGAEFVYA